MRQDAFLLLLSCTAHRGYGQGHDRRPAVWAPAVDSGRDATRRCVFFLLNSPIGDGSVCSVLLVQLHIGSGNHGAELGVKIYDTELPVKLPSRQRRALEFGTSNCGVKLKV